MKATAQAWRLSLLAAVLVHLLALAGWQMVRRRQPAPDWLRAADDTPILLQFSREEPLAQEAGGIPLPPAAPLPPPNGGLPPAATTLPEQASREAAAERTSQGKAAAGSRPGGPRPASRLVRPKGGGAPASPTSAAPRPPALGAGSSARLALEKALHDARATSGEEAPELAKEAKAEPRSGAGNPGPEAEGKPLGNLERTPAGVASLRATPADLRLWGLARKSRIAPGSLEGLPAGLALRELPLNQARRSGAEIQHRRLVRLDDGVLLLWVEGSTVWLVRSPLT